MNKLFFFIWVVLISCSYNSKIKSTTAEIKQPVKAKLPRYIALDAIFYRDSIESLLIKSLESKKIEIISKSELNNLTERSLTDKIKNIKSDNSADYTRALSLSGQNEAVAICTTIAIAFEKDNNEMVIKEIKWKSFGFPPNTKINYQEKFVSLKASNNTTLNYWIQALSDSLINEQIPGIK
jgi:hypothetical protein